MWNKFVEIVQNTSTKRLALAIFVSALLHVYWVSGFDVRLPSLKNEMHAIEARLQIPKIAQKALVKEVAQEVKKQAVKKQPVTVPTLPQEMAQEPPAVLEPPIADLASHALIAAEPVSDTVLTPAPAENNDVTQVEPQPVDAGLVINENAYPYVETDFDVKTEIDGATEGHAKIVFNLIDGKQYQLTSLIKPDGLAALIISNLLQTSTGQLTKSGLQPDSYLYQYGNKADKTYVAKFDWLSKTVSLSTAKGTKTAEIADGTQDLLSFMYQFMYVAPLERMQISIATGKKLTNYHYSFSGEEYINTPLGEIKTIHIFHESENSDEKTELWLALDYQYVPVKIRKTEKKGKVYELVANRINTARPILN